MNMRILAGLALALLAALATVPVAHADEFDRATLLNFSEAVRIPGQVLPAGSYWFVLANHGDNSAVVQIFKSDRTTLVGTLLTVHAERMQAASNTVVTLAEPHGLSNSDAGLPALTKWFYPGLAIGNEFIYSKQTQKKFQHEKEVVVPVQDNGDVTVAGE